MKWIIVKYEWLFYLIYKEFKKVYPKNDDIIRYPITILNLPLAIFIGYIAYYWVNFFWRSGAIIIGLIIIIPQFSYFDNHIEEIEKRYEEGNME
ncbi:MAG: hypothetical protein KDE33_28090 [Bacteroidetes bacterium]|nr:hypothetical protein [Bacteroidota bacterium]MCB9222462.1 hypothetical protein [Ignavibacteria bacterium]